MASENRKFTILDMNNSGEMAELTRNFDWSKTSLGPMSAWPDTLLNLVSFLLSSKFPMFLFWGPELLQFYNDAYRPSLGKDGKHPTALGQKAVDCWPEIWDVIYPLVQKVLAGESIWREDQKIPIYRNGHLEDVYWTFAYTPVRDHSGQISGVLVTCTETTEKMQLIQKLRENEQTFRNLVIQSPTAMCVLRGPDFRVEVANTLMYEIWGSSEKEAVNRPLFEAIPALAGQGFEGLLENVLITGNVYKAFETKVHIIRNGVGEDRYVNFVYQPLREPDGSISGVSAIATDITEERQARLGTHILEERARLAIEASDIGIFDINLVNGFIITSKRHNDIFGFSNQMALEAYLDSFETENVELPMMAYERAKETGILSYEGRIIRPDKSSAWLKVNGRLYFDSDRNAERLVGAVSDITESKFLIKQKDDFIGIASHELKTPLTTITAYVQILQMLVTENKDSRYLPIIGKVNKQVKRLNTLINDLLDTTKIISGKLELVNSRFDFNELVAEVIEDLRLSTTKDLQLVTGESCFVLADRNKIEQAISNLLGNAIKFSPQSPVIKVKTRLDDKEVIFEVQDFGIGIKAEDLDSVFKQFYRAETEMGYTFPGIGLGLFICSEIIHREGGRIWVKSAVNEGSTFSFALPCFEM